MKTLFKMSVAGMLIGACSTSVYAAPFELIRIGDQDGFGYGAAVDPTMTTATNGAGQMLGSDGAVANRDGDSILDAGDLLPDLDGDGVLATGRDDDFDNRSAGEVTGTSVTTIGSVSSVAGTTGSEYTDIALSTSYDTEGAAGMIWDHNTTSYGSGGPFPGDGDPNTLSNQPGFVFDFVVDHADVSAGDDWYFNLVFADYDVTPADIDYTTLGGTTASQAISLQNNGPDDGLIQSAFVALAFSDIFTDIGNDQYRGYLEVDFDAVREPYTAFDFVELSRTAGVREVPAPSTFILLGLGLLGLVGTRRRASK